ncbi:MAG: hypothetical protein NC820_07795, partial [Candidatus Omnitrophica bacterium]|nr:hypothetical protein [Candidatus Omnitrophota bacterium]
FSARALSSGVEYSVGAYRKFAEEVKNITERTGMAAETASKFVTQAEYVGISTELITHSLTYLSKVMVNAVSGNKEASEAFERFGIVIKDTEGKLLPIETVIENIRKRARELGDASVTTAMEMAFFGRSGAELHNYLTLTEKEMNEVSKTAKSLGLILDSLTLDKIEKQQRSLNNLKLIWSSIGKTLYEDFMPAIITVTYWFEKSYSWIRDIASISLTWLGRDERMEEQELRVAEAAKKAGFDINKAVEDFRKHTIVVEEYNKKMAEAGEKGHRVGEEVKKTAEQIKKEQEEFKKASAEIAKHYTQKWALITKDISYLKMAKDQSLKIEVKYWSDVLEHEVLSSDTVLEIREKLLNAQAELWKLGWEAMVVEEENKLNDIKIYFKSSIDNMASEWSSTIAIWMQGGTSFKDFMQSIMDAILHSWIKMVADMVAEWMKVQALKIAGGVLGFLGLQSGGEFIATRPTPIIVGEGSRPELVTVRPLTGGNTVNNMSRNFTNNIYLTVEKIDSSIDIKNLVRSISYELELRQKTQVL